MSIPFLGSCPARTVGGRAIARSSFTVPLRVPNWVRSVDEIPYFAPTSPLLARGFWEFYVEQLAPKSYTITNIAQRTAYDPNFGGGSPSWYVDTAAGLIQLSTFFTIEQVDSFYDPALFQWFYDYRLTAKRGILATIPMSFNAPGPCSCAAGAPELYDTQFTEIVQRPSLIDPSEVSFLEASGIPEFADIIFGGRYVGPLP